MQMKGHPPQKITRPHARCHRHSSRSTAPPPQTLSYKTRPQERLLPMSDKAQTPPFYFLNFFPYSNDLFFAPFHIVHHTIRHDPPTRPGMLEIKAPSDPIHIQYLTRKIKTRDLPALTAGRIHLRQPNSTRRHKLFLKGSLSGDHQLSRTQQAHQPVLIPRRQICPPDLPPLSPPKPANIPTTSAVDQMDFRSPGHALPIHIVSAGTAPAPAARTDQEPNSPGYRNGSPPKPIPVPPRPKGAG